VPTQLVLPQELTIYTIAEQHPRCVAWLHDNASAAGGQAEEVVHVDASGVAEVDAAGVQLLLSLANALTLQHRTLRLDSPSAPLSSACAALGVAALLADARMSGATQ
jgi:ABC-type transporter Mla MlaB component